nr:regulatory protein RecX [uncultured Cellulomonas sp.]
MSRGARRPGPRSGRRARTSEPPLDGPAAADREPDPESVARSIALRLLTGAPRSRAQLAAAMARKDVPEPVAERVLDRFTEVGLIDDAEYARILVRSRHADRGLARRALGVELRRKGIDDELAAEALGTVDAEQEETTARELARRRLAATSGLAREVRVRRVTAMLGRKGYSGGLAHRLVRELLAEEEADRTSGADAASADDGWGDGGWTDDGPVYAQDH